MEEQLFRDLCELIVGQLEQSGVRAVSAWDCGAVEQCDEMIVVVSLKGSKVSNSGFADYLGERYDEASQSMEEVYGHRSQITFGLDLYAPPNGGEREISRGFENLIGLLASGVTSNENVNLRLLEISSGDTSYDEEHRKLKRAVAARCQVHLYTTVREEASFATFEIKGEVSI